MIPSVASSTSMSLQDLIVQTVQDIESKTNTTTTTTDAVSVDKTEDGDTNDALTTKSCQFRTSLTRDELLHKVRNIRAMITDVDGTLLSHTPPPHLHPTTERAIANAVEAVYSPLHPLQYFFPATGKTRSGAMRSLGPAVANLLQQCPGVYVQGLYCLDDQGKVIFEQKLSHAAIAAVETFVTQLQQTAAAPWNLTLLAYDGDVIRYNPTMSNGAAHLQEVHAQWGEPSPVPLNARRDPNNSTTTTTMSLSTYGPSFHKLLIMGNDPVVISQTLRPQLEALVATLSSSTESECVVTQAIPTMLEILPGGCSKAYGVQQVCEYYGIDVSTQVCTLGDAENDYDMIQMASLGIAVGNAIPALQDVADIVMVETSTEGAAGQAIEFFGLGKIIDSME